MTSWQLVVLAKLAACCTAAAGRAKPMHITKRPALDTDADFTRTVHHRAYRDVVVRTYGPWDEAAQDELFKAVWSRANYEVILCDGVQCGYLCVEDRDQDIHLRELVIDPNFQRKGVGTKILLELIERARKREVPVQLSTQVSNRSLNLYRRLGFREFKRTDSHILMKSNQVYEGT
jgi:ribosomal protein S18 acetylase RimI-like enzyme